MEDELKNKLINIAKEVLKNNDHSHDYYHALSVLKNTEKISCIEKGDMDILIPAALFHDAICYSKDSPKSKYSSLESAELTNTILMELEEYPKDKIEKVMECIKLCSYTKGQIPSFLEAKILQDADRLEATGAISIMRTFSSTGSMNKSLFHFYDPFCRNRKPNPLEYGLDLFYTRLLQVRHTMYTKAAKKMAKKRTKILKQFLKSLKYEIK